MRTESDEGIDMYAKTAYDAQPSHAEKDSNALIGSGHANGKMGAAPIWASMLLNGVLVLSLVFIAMPPSLPSAEAQPPSWGPASVCGRTTLDESHRACSRNGILFDGAEDCVCFDCWTGSRCSERLEGAACIVQVDSGTPYIFEDYVRRPPACSVSRQPQRVVYPSSRRSARGSRLVWRAHSGLRILKRKSRSVRATTWATARQGPSRASSAPYVRCTALRATP